MDLDAIKSLFAFIAPLAIVVAIIYRGGRLEQRIQDRDDRLDVKITEGFTRIDTKMSEMQNEMREVRGEMRLLDRTVIKLELNLNAASMQVEAVHETIGAHRSMIEQLRDDLKNLRAGRRLDHGGDA